MSSDRIDDFLLRLSLRLGLSKSISFSIFFLCYLSVYRPTGFVIFRRDKAILIYINKEMQVRVIFRNFLYIFLFMMWFYS